MRRRRPQVDDERARVMWDTVAWLKLADYRVRLEVRGWPSGLPDEVEAWPSPYREIRQAAERLLTAAELALVDAVIAGERRHDELPGTEPGRFDHLDEGSPLVVEAGVRFVDGYGWTADPDVTSDVTSLDDRRQVGGGPESGTGEQPPGCVPFLSPRFQEGHDG